MNLTQKDIDFFLKQYNKNYKTYVFKDRELIEKYHNIVDFDTNENGYHIMHIDTNINSYDYKDYNFMSVDESKNIRYLIKLYRPIIKKDYIDFMLKFKEDKFQTYVFKDRDLIHKFLPENTVDTLNYINNDYTLMHVNSYKDINNEVNYYYYFLDKNDFQIMCNRFQCTIYYYNKFKNSKLEAHYGAIMASRLMPCFGSKYYPTDSKDYQIAEVSGIKYDFENVFNISNEITDQIDVIYKYDNCSIKEAYGKLLNNNLFKLKLDSKKLIILDKLPEDLSAIKFKIAS